MVRCLETNTIHERGTYTHIMQFTNKSHILVMRNKLN